MADLLAIDPVSKEHLFVECLAKGAIETYQSHVKKMRLAERVPFLFVGSLPLDFAQNLPADCWSVAYVGSPQTLTGDWVPPYFRTSLTVPVQFTARVSVGHRITRVTFEGRGLRLAEDTSGFIGAAMSLLLRERLMDWKFKIPQTLMFSVPFNRLGESNTAMIVSDGVSALRFRFGRLPLIAELTGHLQFLHEVLDGLRKIGFPLSQV